MFLSKQVLRDAVSYVGNFADKKVKLCSIPTSVYDAQIVIYTDSFQEVTQALYYEVHTGGQTRVPIAFFGGAALSQRIAEESFTTITGEGGILVGVAYASDPKAILILHDFATDETWPKGGYSEHFTATHQRGRKLLDRLREASGTPDLRLADT
jgi:hypothetical protein